MAQALIDSYLDHCIECLRDSIVHELNRERSDDIKISDCMFSLIYFIKKYLQKYYTSLTHQDYNCKCETHLITKFDWIIDLEESVIAKLDNSCGFRYMLDTLIQMNNSCWLDNMLIRYQLVCFIMNIA